VVRQDSNGNIYLGSYGDSTYLFRYDNLHNNFINLSKELTASHNKDFAVNDLAFSGNEIYLATSEGILRYNESPEFINTGTFTRKNIYSIAVGHDGTIWFSNETGLFRYKDGAYFYYDELDGLCSNTGAFRCLAVDKENKVWFGTVRGLNYSAQNIEIHKTDKPIIKEIFLNDRKIPADTSKLEFVKHSYISFEYISLNYPGSTILYQTKLDGFAEEWTNPENETKIIFPNLPVGKYSFEVRAKQHGSYDWSDSTRYSLAVTPLWYETWWALLLYFLLFLSLIALFNKVYNTHLIKQKRNLEKLVNSHTEEIMDKNKQLEFLNQTKDKFFNIIAHDLKSPFSGILGLSEFLMESFDKMDEKQKIRYIEAINSTANNANSLLENLLVWARTQTNSIEFDPVLIPLEDLIKSSIEFSEAICQGKNIKIQYKMEDPIEIFADVNMITTILRNLINNAVKYSHKDENILIESFKKEDHAVVSVSDHGVGMDQGRLKDLFIISETASTPGTGNEKGTGLGLILCKEFIEKHKGKIWVQSEKGAGSTFWFSIPLKKV
jgi:signal transduction histidine kinase